MRKILIFIFASMFLLSGCDIEKNEVVTISDGNYCEIYYFDTSSQSLKFESVLFEKSSQEELIYNAYSRMINESAKSENIQSAVGAAVEINYVIIDSGTLEIDFTNAYKDMNLSQQLMFRAAVVYTFTSLDYVEYVYITVGGSPIKMSNGQTIGKLGRADFVIDGNISAGPTNYEILMLYFAKSDISGLLTEIREVEVNPNQLVERYIIEQIIAGSKSDKVKNVVPVDVKIREISISDRICYMDLSTEFISKQQGTANEALASVYCIVNSLCEMENIDKVQFLIEGEKVDNYKDVIDLSKPIEPEYDISFD